MVYDLGCGDGRIVVAAAKKYGVKAHRMNAEDELEEGSQETEHTLYKRIVPWEKEAAASDNLAPSTADR